MQQQTQFETQQTPDTSASSFVPVPLQSDENTLEITDAQNTSVAWTQAMVSSLQRRTRQRKMFRIACALCYCIAGLLLFTLSSIGLHTLLPILNVFFPIVCLLGFGALARRQDAQAREVLTRIEDTRFIGPLAEILTTEQTGKQRHVIATLCRLLPQVRASDTDLLTRQQRACLYKLLTRNRLNSWTSDKPLQIAILKALEQIGDKEALPPVQRLAKWSSDTKVREAANNCLRYLHVRAEEYRRGADLLRPSDARTSAPDVLLRASTGMTAAAANTAGATASRKQSGVKGLHNRP